MKIFCCLKLLYGKYFGENVTISMLELKTKCFFIGIVDYVEVDATNQNIILVTESRPFVD